MHTEGGVEAALSLCVKLAIQTTRYADAANTSDTAFVVDIDFGGGDVTAEGFQQPICGSKGAD